MKIVINTCYGGFGLSEEAMDMYTNLGGDWEELFGSVRINPSIRADPKLIEVVEKLGSGAYGRHARLKVIEIPDDVQWYITDYDGVETIREHHQRWN